MSITPSAPPDANGTSRGFLSAVAQIVGGAKTFLATIIASAGIQVASLFNTNGTGASDVAVKVGTSTADGSVNASAKLLSARTGLGGSEVERFFIDKLGGIVGGVAGTNAQQRIIAVERSATAFEVSQGVGLQTPAIILRQVTGGKSVALLAGTGGTMISFDDTAAFSIGPEVRSQHNSGTPGNAPTLTFQVTGSAGINIRGTDDSATVGNSTVNKPSGINTLASGATTVTITNSLVPNPATTKVRIKIDWRADPGGRWWVTQNNGSFTVNVSAAPGANASFNWEVVGII